MYVVAITKGLKAFYQPIEFTLLSESSAMKINFPPYIDHYIRLK